MHFAVQLRRNWGERQGQDESQNQRTTTDILNSNFNTNKLLIILQLWYFVWKIIINW